jgi:hypothetical protein
MIPLIVLQRACECAENGHGLRFANQYLKRHGFITFGIEHISIEDREIVYINLGDTYDCTVIQEGHDYFTGSWGDWVSEVELENEEN